MTCDLVQVLFCVVFGITRQILSMHGEVWEYGTCTCTTTNIINNKNTIKREIKRNQKLLLSKSLFPSIFPLFTILYYIFYYTHHCDQCSPRRYFCVSVILPTKIYWKAGIRIQTCIIYALGKSRNQAKIVWRNFNLLPKIKTH